MICVLTWNGVQVPCHVKETSWRLVYRLWYLYVRKVGIWRYIREFAYIFIEKRWKDKQEMNTDADL